MSPVWSPELSGAHCESSMSLQRPILVVGAVKYYPTRTFEVVGGLELREVVFELRLNLKCFSHHMCLRKDYASSKSSRVFLVL